MLKLEPNSNTPLTTQIASGFRKLIAERRLTHGMKVPSIRQFARSHGVSTSTVVEAYDRLVAEGQFVARQSSGFYVRNHGQQPAGRTDLAPRPKGIAFDKSWLLQRIWESGVPSIQAGCGWIPSNWLDEELIRRNLRQIATRPGVHLTSYGQPKGLPALRKTISDLLGEREVCAPPDSIVLTSGGSHALALLAQCLVRPGDAVFVDDPGYSVLTANLNAYHARIIGVPWDAQGPNLERLEALLQEHKPRVFFTNPRLQNPTGASYAPRTAHRVLQLADQHDFILIENDVSSELDPLPRRSLASLDQLHRVIYVGSFSKSISPSLRVGFIAADDALIEELTATKMSTGLSTSELTERLTYEILTEGRYRKQLKSLRGRLGEALAHSCHHLEKTGLQLFATPTAGMFVWARHPGFQDAVELSMHAAELGILLAPGRLFSAAPENRSWMRFNAAFCQNPRLYEFLAAA